MNTTRLPTMRGLFPQDLLRLLNRMTLTGLAAASLMTATAPAQDAAPEDQVFELSPFLVESNVQGWVARETLAGSRMRTNLGDVASQVEVLTLDFMDDYGLTSLEDAAIYTVNAENAFEYASSGAGKIGNEGNVRIRGLSTATRSREFFATYAKTDNYNLDRVTISSGPNPMMFGTGSPSGAVDVTLARPYLDEDFLKLRLQVDDWGSLRGELHFNQVLADDKLAVRVSLLSDKKDFFIEPSFEETRRLYAALLWKPWKRTRISFHYENIDMESRRPARNTPYDEFTAWAHAGDLGSVYPNMYLYANDGSETIQDDKVFTASGNDIVVTMGYNPAGVPVLGSNGSVRTGRLDTSAWKLIDQVNKDIDGMTVLDDTIFPRDVNTMYNLEWEEDKSAIYNLFINHEIIDNLHLEIAYQREEYDDFYANMMGFRDSVTLHADPNKFLTNGEPNPYAGMLYMDGTADTNVGDRTRDEARASLSYEFDFRDHSDNRLVRWLGKHRAAVLFSGIRQEFMTQEYRYHIQPKFENGRFRDAFFEGFNYGTPDSQGRLALSPFDTFNASTGTRYMQFRTYVVPGGPLVPQNDFAPGSPFEIVDSNGEVWMVDPTNAGVGTEGERLITGRITNGLKEKFDTEQLSYQAFLWNDRIVVTLGWRTDSLESADELSPAVMWQNPETGAIVAAGSAGFQPHRDLWTYEDYENESTGSTTLKGVVLHPFRNWKWRLPFGADASFFYSESNTFQPSRSELNPDGTFVEGEAGDGKDYGVNFSLADGKFNIRVNHYEVIAGPTNLNLPFRRFRFALRPVMRDILQGLVANEADFRAKFPVWPLVGEAGSIDEKVYPFASGQGFQAMNFFNYGDPYAMSADTAAEGDEVTLTWTPNRNWSFRATWAKQEVIQTNIASQWIDFANQIYDIMENTTFTEGYIPGNGAAWANPAGRDMNGNGIIEQFKWDSIPDGGGTGATNPTFIDNFAWGQNNDKVAGGWTRNTMKEQFVQDVFNGNASIPVMLAYEGRPNEFVRENRLNLNVMYRFTEGVLDGWRIGGGYRWREAPAIGFGVQTIGGAQVPDTSIILKGEKETAVDLSLGYSGRSKWLGDRRFSVSLNVRNVFEDKDYVPKHVDFFTGNVLSQVRVDGRQFIFSFEIDL